MPTAHFNCILDGQHMFANMNTAQVDSILFGRYVGAAHAYRHVDVSGFHDVKLMTSLACVHASQLVDWLQYRADITLDVGESVLYTWAQV